MATKDVDVQSVLSDVQELLAEIRSTSLGSSAAVMETKVAISEARASVAETRASVAELRSSLAIISGELVDFRALLNTIIDSVADLRNDFEDFTEHQHIPIIDLTESSDDDEGEE